MLKNCLLVGLRSLLRHPLYSVINISGLAIGIACSMMIWTFIQYELSYDGYHEKADRLYRVVLNARLMGKEIRGAVAPAPMAGALTEEVSEVETATRLRTRGDVYVRRGDRRFTEEVFYADRTYFDVFTHRLVRGDPATALKEPNSIVLTESAAEKYFGSEPAIGAGLTLNSDEYIVTGVAEDMPANSHFHFSLLGSLVTRADSRSQSWLSNNYRTYLVLKEGRSPEAVDARLAELVQKYAAPQIAAVLNASWDDLGRADGNYAFFLQPVRDVHLFSDLDVELEPGGDVLYVYIFAAIAVLVLVVACINYVNLATARALNRAREIGMRKTLGAYRGQLILQLLAESTVLATFATLIAHVVVHLTLPVLSDRLSKPLSVEWTNGFFLGVSALLALLVGLAAGSYPAFLMASFRPQEALKTRTPAAGNGGMRSALVVFQFLVSIVLMVGTVVVFDQLQYVQNKPLGFRKEHLIVLHRTWPVRAQMATLKEELLRDSRILAVTATSNVPGRSFSNTVFTPEGASGDQSVLLWTLGVDEDFYSTMEMELVDGRGPSGGLASDSTRAVLNESAAELIGWKDGAVGRRLMGLGATSGDREAIEVIGVVRDFHFESLHQQIRPLIMRTTQHRYSRSRFVVIRVRTPNLTGVLASVREKWQSVAGDAPFRFTFLEDDLDALYREDRKTAGIIGGFSLFAILIGCLGLFGLTSFTTTQRTKEIGVRKALGASVGSVLVLLSRDVVRLVIAATVIAWPVAYYLMADWLENFVYRTTLGPSAFLLGGGAALGTALATVSVLTVRAAHLDPVRALRDE